MTPIPTELRELLERIVAGDVGRMIYAKLATGQATETDDGKAWLELRALLATPPADAADMGGQAGEEVEVWKQMLRLQQELYADAMIAIGNALGIDVSDEPRCKHVAAEAVSICAELAQHRQQAGKLAEALRQVRGYTDSPHVVGVIDEALADWEKTNA